MITDDLMLPCMFFNRESNNLSFSTNIAVESLAYPTSTFLSSLMYVVTGKERKKDILFRQQSASCKSIAHEPALHLFIPIIIVMPGVQPSIRKQESNVASRTPGQCAAAANPFYDKIVHKS
ncbi:hypothetical protein J3458_004717 [Metarhizium acridum]|uniref:uncharacterized protein n=1 Tax=Metarhizium acridum TaxID=92637 RepID=UPI001C6C4513|nr:hypothetical protein J3458_004717 [Metarhizium acridum]